jgi:hypothetical protein
VVEKKVSMANGEEIKRFRESRTSLVTVDFVRYSSDSGSPFSLPLMDFANWS